MAKIEMKVSSYHLVDNLAGGLYENPGQQLMELIRNGVVASMPDPKKWEPKKAYIEVSLVQNHPLANKGPALVVLDHGSGITAPGFNRYFEWLGTPHVYVNSSATGASKKGIGRIAALSLNKNCIVDNYDVQRRNGYYLLTRTSRSGKIRFVTVKPMMSDEGGFEIDNWLEPDDNQLGNLKEIIGSFTAVVIPTPVFDNHTDIYGAVKWHLPREQDKMFNFSIGGKAVQPPPLEKDINLSSQDGRFRARLGVGDTNSDGVWLCDQETGFRVASCQRMYKQLPEPLGFPDLAGDIFAPGLLHHQNTARSTLSKEFTQQINGRWQNKEYQDLMMFLIRQVAPAAKEIIERDAIEGDAAKILDELVEIFNVHFGLPEKNSVTENVPVDKEKPEKTGTIYPNPKPEEHTTKDDGHKKDHQVYRRYISIRVRDETFHLYRGQSLHPFIFAQVNPSNKRMIQVNVRGGYKALPRTKEARKEHCLMQILYAIGNSKFSGRTHEAITFANKIRSEFVKK